MSKYTPLEHFLEKATTVEVPMNFNEIERIIGCPLPTSSKKYPAWWSNESSTHVQAEAWKNAGYKTTSVNLASEKLVFVRVSEPATHQPDSGPAMPRRHPAFGCMKGTVTIAEGVDLTDPADPELSQLADDMRLPE